MPSASPWSALLPVSCASSHRLGERRRRDAPAAGVELDAGEPDERVRKHVGGAGVARLGDQPSEHLAGARVPARDGERGAEVRMRLTRRLRAVAGVMASARSISATPSS